MPPTRPSFVGLAFRSFETRWKTEIIEYYPDDKYGPSCLILGHTRLGRPLHVQCSHPSKALIKVITLYEPDPSKWVGFRERRSRDA